MTNMTKKDLMKLIATMPTEELEKLAITALGHKHHEEEDITLSNDVEPVRRKTKLNATDAEVTLVQNDTEVTFGTAPKDVYTVLKNKAEALGGKYDRTIRGFVFDAAEMAEEFARTTLVTADERNAVRKTWGWK